MAVESGYDKVVKLILKHGDDRDALNRRGQTPFDIYKNKSDKQMNDLSPEDSLSPELCTAGEVSQLLGYSVRVV